MHGISGIYDFENLKINYSNYNDKFDDDNVYIENDNYIFALEGCILNSKELKIKYNTRNMYETLRYLWKEYKENITQHIRGSFILVIYDKTNNYLFLTNDLLSKRPLYIFKSDKILMFSSRYFDLIEMVKSKKIILTINKLAIAMMLTKGYLLDDLTYSNEINYLKAYQYVVINNDEIKQQEYNKNVNLLEIKEEEIIKNLNEKFSFAVKEQFQKNIDYGYKNTTTLSAGMDSRTCLLYANKLGYKDILCISYAQSNSVDYEISKQIAFDYNFEYIFYALDSAKFMLMPSTLSKRNECQQTYWGSTGAFQIFNNLDTNESGIIHTGLLGGEVLSDVFTQPNFTNVNCNAKEMKNLPLWDTNLSAKYKELKSTYESEEEYLLYGNMRACQNFIRMVEYKCEAFSPFMHEDFFNFCNCIPPEFKYRRNIYKKWMNEYIPNSYVTTYFKTQIKSSSFKVLAINGINRFIKKIKGKTKYDMNPMEYWGETVPHLREDLNKIYEIELKSIANIPNDIEESIELVKSKGIVGSVKAITVLKAMKLL